MEATVYHWSHQLHQAASENNTDNLQQLLKQGHSPNIKGGVQCWLRGACSSQTRTPLHYAAKEGHLNSIRLLLVYGADPNIKDEDGYTPLHYICQIYKPAQARYGLLRKCVESLIQFGADFNAQTNSYYTPRELAVRQNNAPCSDELDRHSNVVPSLLNLSRHRVVGLIHSKYFHKVQRLEIPDSLKVFLMYNDVIRQWQE